MLTMAHHSFSPGEIVTVFGLHFSKGLVIEGRACVVDLIDDVAEQYVVRFQNDKGGCLFCNRLGRVFRRGCARW